MTGGRGCRWCQYQGANRAGPELPLGVRCTLSLHLNINPMPTRFLLPVWSIEKAQRADIINGACLILVETTDRDAIYSPSAGCVLARQLRSVINMFRLYSKRRTQL